MTPHSSTRGRLCQEKTETVKIYFFLCQLGLKGVNLKGKFMDFQLNCWGAYLREFEYIYFMKIGQPKLSERETQRSGCLLHLSDFLIRSCIYHMNLNLSLHVFGKTFPTVFQ